MIVITGDGVQGIHPPLLLKISSLAMSLLSLLTQRIQKVKKNQSGHVQVSAIYSSEYPSVKEDRKNRLVVMTKYLTF